MSVVVGLGKIRGREWAGPLVALLTPRGDRLVNEHFAPSNGLQRPLDLEYIRLTVGLTKILL